MSIWLSLALAAPLSHDFPAAARTLDLDSVSGNVNVHTGGDHIVVRSTPRADNSMCEVVFTDADATVRSAPRGKSTITQDCTVDFDVTMPAGTALGLILKAGNVEIVHDGAFTADLGAGNITGKLSAAANLKVAAGNVALGGLVSPVEVRATAGNVALIFDKAPEGTILVNVAAGGVHIDLPDDAEVDARVPTGVTFPQPQKTTASTKLLIGKAIGTITVE